MEVPDRWQTMSLVSGGSTSIPNRNSATRIEHRRSGCDVSDIEGSQPSNKSTMYLKNRPNLHSPTDIPGTSSIKLVKERKVGQDPRFMDTFIPGTKSDGRKSLHSKKNSNRIVNPLEPKYDLPSCPIVPVPDTKFLRDHQNIDDIPGTRSMKLYQYPVRDSYSVHDIEGARANWRPPHQQKVRDAPPRDILDCNDIVKEGFKTTRTNNPLDPVYRINGYTVQDTEFCKPRKGRAQRNAPDFSLSTTDISGASPTQWKSNASEALRATNLLSDIPGASADSSSHGLKSNRRVDPNCPVYRSLDGKVSPWTDISPHKYKPPSQGQTSFVAPAQPKLNTSKGRNKAHQDIQSVCQLPE